MKIGTGESVKGYLKSQHTRRNIRLATASIMLAALLLSLPAFARTPAQKKQLAAEQFQRAEQMRAELMSTPAAQRARRDYQQVTEAYRRVYYLSPIFNRADESVVNVADLLAETARAFNDDKLAQSAIRQYEFLRREYPGSKFRVDALYAIALMYRDDLKNTEKARATLQEFLHRYPRSPLADDARKALADLDLPQKRNAKKQAMIVRDSVLGPMPVKPAAVESARTENEASAETPKQRKQAASVPPAVEPAAAQAAVVTVAEDKAQQKPEHHSTLPLVTGIRYWSTPDYTRVAIDLESEVEYEAGRIANPDRIFFDLHNTKLSSALVGKTFEVGDGFLLKIRAAQYQIKMTRIVLDVANISDYSAFLLPNPYRLIIDIHGKKARTVNSAAVKPTPAVTDQSSTPATMSPLTTATAKPPVTTAPKSDTPAAKVEHTKVEPQPEFTKKPELKAAEPKAAVKEPLKIDDVTTATAKNGQPELKATSKPTSAPTYESVAPRDEILPKASRRKRTPPAVLTHEARPTSSGERSLTRALGLKIGRIVIDAGHGGHDTGTIGPSGLQEKDLVLDVALRLGKLLQSRMNAEVVYTRSDDTFIPLETRTAIANQQQADLFISIHANSSRDASARGVETYYLNFTSSPEALEVAARENSVSEKSIHELQDLVKKITLKDKIDESREFAADVQRSLYTGIAAKTPAVRNRGVKKAPFIVLIGANMPSILAEISFISNPVDEKRLFTPEYRQKIADYLYSGIDRYVEGLSGIKIATRDVPPSTSKTAKVAADSDR